MAKYAPVKAYTYESESESLSQSQSESGSVSVSRGEHLQCLIIIQVGVFNMNEMELELESELEEQQCGYKKSRLVTLRKAQNRTAPTQMWLYLRIGICICIRISGCICICVPAEQSNQETNWVIGSLYSRSQRHPLVNVNYTIVSNHFFFSSALNLSFHVSPALQRR